uniref:RING-type domain-containing protein n=1 Tax=Magallana gigas TaxID=29159 RepID=A0A8W8K7T6_MAGGI
MKSKEIVTLQKEFAKGLSFISIRFPVPEYCTITRGGLRGGRTCFEPVPCLTKTSEIRILAMATAVCKDPELRCTICLEKFNLPKILSCLHTFCEPCIQSYVQNCAGRKHQLFPMPFVPHED